ncbi:mitochondrial nuclease [Ascosphaera apis ARSEF 7405]|uniref:Endonuclease n=1 Tax=Ascosphaera apis ARSEF 7405 TaxID=392613 RepID=A0A162I3J8_9EURO|nr:mitochondrial nuclease [Ascosphaera apis ARSEF 7405]
MGRLEDDFPVTTRRFTMSKATVAIIAAASAATGAGLSALWCHRGSDRIATVQTAPQTTTPSTFTRLPGPPVPPNQIPAPSLVRNAASPVDPTGLFEYGFPGPVVDDLTDMTLAGGYDRRTKNPYWIAEHITADSLKEKHADRKHSSFYEDERIPSAFRAKLQDYFRSGYDRGHQMPAADAKWSQEAMDKTFALSNMCPQVGDGFNRDYWAHFEDFCRRLTQKYPSVRIVTGPLYLPKRDSDGKWRVSYEMIGNPPNVAVPTHFYKVIFAEDGKKGGKVSLGAFVLPNAKIPNDKSLQDFEVPLQAIERASGLEFATKLDSSRQKKLCKEVKCEITVREFKKALPSSK